MLHKKPDTILRPQAEIYINRSKPCITMPRQAPLHTPATPNTSSASSDLRESIEVWVNEGGAGGEPT